MVQVLIMDLMFEQIRIKRIVKGEYSEEETSNDQLNLQTLHH